LVVLEKNAGSLIVNVLKEGCCRSPKGKPGRQAGRKRAIAAADQGPHHHSRVKFPVNRFPDVPVPDLLQFLILPGIQYGSQLRVDPRMHSLELLQFLNS
jgi:hypothetical protein